MVRFTPHPEETFLICRRTGRDSAISCEFSTREARAEKRMSFCAWHSGTYRSFLDRLGKSMSLTERSQKGSSLISTSRLILGLLEQVLVGVFFPKMCNSVAFALHIY
jgi:hypothetical protein